MKYAKNMKPAYVNIQQFTLYPYSMNYDDILFSSIDSRGQFCTITEVYLGINMI